MKPNEFERELERQPMRRVPAGWRREILASARAASRPAAAAEAVPAWRLWLDPIPLAWASLAAVWAVLIGLNLWLTGGAGGHGVSAAPPLQARGLEPLTAWHLQKSELSLLEDRGSTETTLPPALPPRPRSDLRREGRWADGDTRTNLGFLS
ncbi:MAG: hypothetical protein U1F98_13715 [Verrucomicrobiota bacterium]